MIIDPEGHILTNHHVVGGATKIEVILSDGRKFAASLIGSDPKTDLAVIKISAKEPLPYVTFGDSDQVQIGEWVVAIGHPRGLDQTVTHGIISAKHRRGITDPSSYQDFLQTDAAINPGNSGGPLLNLKGEVIGVNAAIVSESGGFEGIGFTIPSNMALHVAKSLILHGKVERGWLGVNIQDLTAELAKSLHVEGAKGALIIDVVKGGPADKAGLRKNDLIIAYRGKEIADSGALRNEVANTPIGQEVGVTIIRNGIKQELLVKVGNLEEASKFLIGAVKDRLGAEVRALTPKESEEFGLAANRGIIITSINPKGPLGKAGFEVGDIILEINGQPIINVESFVQLLATLKANQKITLLALDHRSGNMGYVQVVVK
jgi:serine protease Do